MVFHLILIISKYTTSKITNGNTNNIHLFNLTKSVLRVLVNKVQGLRSGILFFAGLVLLTNESVGKS